MKQKWVKVRVIFGFQVITFFQCFSYSTIFKVSEMFDPKFYQFGAREWGVGVMCMWLVCVRTSKNGEGRCVCWSIRDLLPSVPYYISCRQKRRGEYRCFILTLFSI